MNQTDIGETDRFGEWVTVDCLHCGKETILSCRAIISVDHPPGTLEMEAIIQCDGCGCYTKVTKMLDQVAVITRGTLSDWEKIETLAAQTDGEEE